MREGRSPNKRFGFGLVLVLLGMIFLADNLDLIPRGIARHLFDWQGILIIIGSAFLISGKNRTPGIIMISVGVFFLLPEIFDYYWFRPRIYWPLILIIVGLILIARRQQQSGYPKRTPENEMDVLDDVSIFGGSEVVIASQNFKGGKSTAIFGGSTFNMTKAALDDQGATLDVFFMFGGSTFIVPAEWKVKVDVTAIFGGFSDKRTPTESAAAETKKLIVTGLVLFGGGEIKSF